MYQQREIIHSQSSIFFGPQPKELYLRNAKICLIEDVFKARRFEGKEPTAKEFDELYDLDIDELHLEVIKAQDKAYFSVKN